MCLLGERIVLRKTAESQQNLILLTAPAHQAQSLIRIWRMSGEICNEALVGTNYRRENSTYCC